MNNVFCWIFEILLDIVWIRYRVGNGDFFFVVILKLPSLWNFVLRLFGITVSLVRSWWQRDFVEILKCSFCRNHGNTM